MIGRTILALLMFLCVANFAKPEFDPADYYYLPADKCLAAINAAKVVAPPEHQEWLGTLQRQIKEFQKDPANKNVPMPWLRESFHHFQEHYPFVN